MAAFHGHEPTVRVAKNREFLPGLVHVEGELSGQVPVNRIRRVQPYREVRSLPVVQRDDLLHPHPDLFDVHENLLFQPLPLENPVHPLRDSVIVRRSVLGHARVHPLHPQRCVVLVTTILHAPVRVMYRALDLACPDQQEGPVQGVQRSFRV